MLGQIENGQSVPSVIIACRIADALAVPVQPLIESNLKPRISVIRRDPSPRETTRIFEWQILSASGGCDAIEVAELRLQPGSKEQIEAHRNCRTILLTLASGEVVVKVGCEPPIALLAGDAVSFEGGFDSVVTNGGHEQAVLIVVVQTSPAHF